MTLQTIIPPKPTFQRARGALSISAVRDDGRASHLQNLRQEGSYRAIFPRAPAGKIEAVAINTAGGVTGGDQFAITVAARNDAQITVTTQAAERIYKAVKGGAGQITNRLSIARSAQVFWLPQETILFNGCHVHRRLNVDIDPTGSALILEPLVFGREASGERIQACDFRDSVSINSESQPIYLDRLKLNGDLATTLLGPAIADGARAMASLVFVDPKAAQMLAPCRDLLPATAGASLLSDRVLVLRLLARDSYTLRTALLPILKLLTNDTVPKNWRL